jgi:hypothetical protein
MKSASSQNVRPNACIGWIHSGPKFIATGPERGVESDFLSAMINQYLKLAPLDKRASKGK